MIIELTKHYSLEAYNKQLTVILKEYTLNIHEYQAKQIFAKYGVPTPRGIIANTPLQAATNAQELGGNIWVVKAQIHADRKSVV